MFEKVLFATDFSPHAEKIGKCGVLCIPGVREVVLLHVVDRRKWMYGGESGASAVKRAELLLREEKERLEEAGEFEEVRAIVKVGMPSREILTTAREEQVSLVVMGSRGKSLIREIVLGSVSSDVLRYGESNLLIIGHKGGEKRRGVECFHEQIFSKVLIPTDFSEHSKNVVSAVQRMKGVEKVVLLHVVARGETQEEIEAAVENARERLEEIGDTFTGVDVRTHVYIGDPAEEINRVAEEEDASLIAIGTKGKGIFKEIRVGSTAECVVRSSRRPVLALKNVQRLAPAQMRR
jgi:nucleotide-binding universal stress UspA family protein